MSDKELFKQNAKKAGNNFVKRKTISKESISFSQYAKLRTLFEKQNWEIDEELEISTFERYVKTLSKLSVEQQDFILKLSSRFLHIEQNKYLEELLGPLKALRSNYPDSSLIFLPCLPKEDQGKTKSSTAVLYQLKGTTIKKRIQLGKHYVCESISPDVFKRLENRDFLIILVDDFVGTGETALGAVDYVRELCPFMESNKQIKVLCIVAMQEGISKMAANGVDLFCGHIEAKGISDYYTGDELDQAKEQMESIEKEMKTKSDFHFGYGESEALVCMERCPNNTFPIYWATKNLAPYER